MGGLKTLREAFTLLDLSWDGRVRPTGGGGVSLGKMNTSSSWAVAGAGEGASTEASSSSSCQYWSWPSRSSAAAATVSAGVTGASTALARFLRVLGVLGCQRAPLAPRRWTEANQSLSRQCHSACLLLGGGGRHEAVEGRSMDAESPMRALYAPFRRSDGDSPTMHVP